MNTVEVSALKYLPGYNPDTLAQVAQLVATQRLGHWLLQRYPAIHGVRNYLQLEFEVQVYLTYQELVGGRLWEVAGVGAGETG